MNIAVDQSPLGISAAQSGPENNADVSRSASSNAEKAAAEPRTRTGAKVRICVAAEYRLLREALARMLTKGENIEVLGSDPSEPFLSKALKQGGVDVLLLVSKVNLEQDLAVIREVHSGAPSVRILMIGMTKENGEFLQCVRAGVSGYLWREAPMDDVLEGIQAVQAGEAVCPGALCTVLFQYFEHESSPLPCASVRQRLGLAMS